MNTWYLYLLLNNNYVFYVGVTKWPLSRFQQHCSSPAEPCYYYVYWMKQNNNMPTFKVVEEFESKQHAEFAEEVIIKTFVTLKHKLCNVDLNPIVNRFIKCIPIEKQNKRMKLYYAHEPVYNELKNFKRRYEYFNQY